MELVWIVGIFTDLQYSLNHIKFHKIPWKTTIFLRFSFGCRSRIPLDSPGGSSLPGCYGLRAHQCLDRQWILLAEQGTKKRCSVHFRRKKNHGLSMVYPLLIQCWSIFLIHFCWSPHKSHPVFFSPLDSCEMGAMHVFFWKMSILHPFEASIWTIRSETSEPNLLSHNKKQWIFRKGVCLWGDHPCRRF